ncbi:MAG: hypothetical protein RR800_12155 [Comamonas sp.]
MPVNVISQTRFTLQRDDVQRTMLAQRDASDAVLKSKTGVWRKIRFASIAAVPVLALIAATVQKGLGTQICFGLMLLLGVLFYASHWNIKQRMYEMGARRTVSRQSVIQMVQQQIFKGQPQLACTATFDENGLQLQQGDLQLAAAYDDASRIGIIFERQGMLQITPATNSSPGAIFFIPLQQLPNAQAVMQRLQRSPSFVAVQA